MGYQWLPHTSFLTCTKTRKLYFQKLYFQYHWFAAEFHCLAVGYTWLMCTKKFEGHIVPPNCSYSIIGPSLWIFSAAVGVACPQPLQNLSFREAYSNNLSVFFNIVQKGGGGVKPMFKNFVANILLF